MRYPDGKRLKRVVSAGWLWLDHNRERLNAIAVDPSIADRIVSILKEKFSADNVITAEIGPTVGTLAGPGTRCRFFVRG